MSEHLHRRLKAVKQRSQEREEDEHDDARVRRAVFWLLYFACAVVVISGIAYVTCSQLPEYELRGPKVTVDDATPLSALPPIVIWNDNTVDFGDVHCEATDEDLNALYRRLRTVVAQVGPDNPIVIEPSDDVLFERIVDVVSAISRAGIREYTLF